MQNPIGLEAYAQDLIRRRLDEAARDALADQVQQRDSDSFNLARAARHYVADGLRAMALRLDPCVLSLEACASNCEPRLALVRSR